MNHPNCDYFKFIDGITPEIKGLYMSLEYLNIKLDNSNKDLIKQNDIYITYPSGPGSIIKMRLNKEEQIRRLIVIDKTMIIQFLKFDYKEIAAAILHEVGHFLNKPPDDQKNDKEFYADDFARKCGLENELKSGFVKYINEIEKYSDPSIGRSFFNDINEQNQIIKLFNDRISRIRNDSPFLVGSIENGT